MSKLLFALVLVVLLQLAASRESLNTCMKTCNEGVLACFRKCKTHIVRRAAPNADSEQYGSSYRPRPSRSWGWDNVLAETKPTRRSVKRSRKFFIRSSKRRSVKLFGRKVAMLLKQFLKKDVTGKSRRLRLPKNPFRLIRSKRSLRSKRVKKVEEAADFSNWFAPSSRSSVRPSFSSRSMRYLADKPPHGCIFRSSKLFRWRKSRVPRSKRSIKRSSRSKRVRKLAMNQEADFLLNFFRRSRSSSVSRRSSSRSSRRSFVRMYNVRRSSRRSSRSFRHFVRDETEAEKLLTYLFPRRSSFVRRSRSITRSHWRRPSSWVRPSSRRSSRRIIRFYDEESDARSSRRSVRFYDEESDKPVLARSSRSRSQRSRRSRSIRSRSQRSRSSRSQRSRRSRSIRSRSHRSRRSRSIRSRSHRSRRSRRTPAEIRQMLRKMMKRFFEMAKHWRRHHPRSRHHRHSSRRSRHHPRSRHHRHSRRHHPHSRHHPRSRHHRHSRRHHSRSRHHPRSRSHPRSRHSSRRSRPSSRRSIKRSIAKNKEAADFFIHWFRSIRSSSHRRPSRSSWRSRSFRF